MKTLPTLFVTFLLGFSIAAMAQSKKRETFNTPNGSVTTTTETVEPVPQKIVIANRKGITEIDGLVAKAKVFVTAFLPSASNPSLKDCDEALIMWQREKRTYTDRQVTAMLGAYLGNKLIADFQMEWVIVTDQYGTDYAVRAKKYEVMSFPFSSVSERVEKKESNFMVPVYEIVKHAMTKGDFKTR